MTANASEPMHPSAGRPTMNHVEQYRQAMLFWIFAACLSFLAIVGLIVLMASTHCL